jgi:hypothetical protein
MSNDDSVGSLCMIVVRSVEIVQTLLARFDACAVLVRQLAKLRPFSSHAHDVTLEDLVSR